MANVLIDGLSYPLAKGRSFRRTLDPGYPPVLVSEAEKQVSSYLPHQTIFIPPTAGIGRFYPRGDEPLSPNILSSEENINSLFDYFTLGPLKKAITNKPANVTARYNKIIRVGRELWSIARALDDGQTLIARSVNLVGMDRDGLMFGVGSGDSFSATSFSEEATMGVNGNLAAQTVELSFDLFRSHQVRTVATRTITVTSRYVDTSYVEFVGDDPSNPCNYPCEDWVDVIQGHTEYTARVSYTYSYTNVAGDVDVDYKLRIGSDYLAGAADSWDEENDLDPGIHTIDIVVPSQVAYASADVMELEIQRSGGGSSGYPSSPTTFTSTVSADAARTAAANGSFAVGTQHTFRSIGLRNIALRFPSGINVGAMSPTATHPLVYGVGRRVDSTVQVDVTGWGTAQAVAAIGNHIAVLGRTEVSNTNAAWIAEAELDDLTTWRTDFPQDLGANAVFGDLIARENGTYAVIYTVNPTTGPIWVRAITPPNMVWDTSGDERLEYQFEELGAPRELVEFPDATGELAVWSSTRHHLRVAEKDLFEFEHPESDHTGQLVRISSPIDCLLFTDGPNLYHGAWSSGQFSITALGPNGIDDGVPADSYGDITSIAFARDGGVAGWIFAAMGSTSSYPSIYVYDIDKQSWKRPYKGDTEGRLIRSIGYSHDESGVPTLTMNEDNGDAGDTDPFQFRHITLQPRLVDGYEFCASGKIQTMELTAETPLLNKGWRNVLIAGEGIDSDQSVSARAATEFDHTELGNAGSAVAVTSNEGRVWFQRGGDLIIGSEGRTPGLRAKALALEFGLERGSDATKAPEVRQLGVTFKPHAGALSYLTMVLDFTKGHRGKQPRQLIDELIAAIDKAGAEDVRVVLSPNEEYWGASDRDTISNFQAQAESTFLGGALPTDWRGLTVVQFKEVF